MTSRGQSLVELAICAPAVAMLGLGAIAVAQVADARSGLEAATQAAAATAARAPDEAAARMAAQARFSATLAAYPITDPKLELSLGSFARGGTVQARSSAFVDIAWTNLLLFPTRLQLHAQAVTQLETFRTRGAAP
ncbi:MAG TPA: TadE/TadG family type IV pilus assembly protein [Candidatus Dormibacteraeota bacterium]